MFTQEKVYFLEMPGILESAFGLTGAPGLRNDFHVVPLELSVTHDDSSLGKILAGDLAVKAAFGLSQLPTSQNESIVCLGTGAIVICNGRVISELKGDLESAVGFLRSISGNVCSLHFAIFVLRGETQYFEFEIVVRRITERDIETIREEESSERIDFVDLLLRFEAEENSDMRFLREKQLSKCGLFLQLHLDLV